MTEDRFPGEERLLVPSPAIVGYDKQPAMSAAKVTDGLVGAIKSDQFDFMVVNYANPDMVGHTGNLAATIKAIEFVDGCLDKVIPEIVGRGGAAFIVGDHGNAEELMKVQTGEIDKEHSTFPVPFIAVVQKWQTNTGLNKDLSALTPSGVLSDVAPTILKVAGLPKPKEMTGANLFHF